MLKYRSEIDGLRALAVIPVIFFHLGLETFSGGFVGVDVFFVISGFLITTLLLKDLKNGTFSLSNFWLRRAKRILPAIFFVIILSIPWAWLSMLPQNFSDYSLSILATLLFSSNIFFWFKSGYFSPSSEEIPLLHTWSLAVEEQFYIFFPLILLLFWKYKKKYLIIFILALSVSSFILSEFGWRYDANLNFYLTPFRIWELLLGSITAFILLEKEYKKSNAISLLALSMIIIPFFTYSHSTPVPSYFALLPTLGTCIFLIFSSSNIFVGKLLSSKPIALVGLMSYSLYLVHQPVLAYFRIFMIDLSQIRFAVCALLIITFLSYLSYNFIEKPFRHLKKEKTPTFLISLASIFIPLTLFSFFGYYNQGYKFRFNIPDTVHDSIKRSELQKLCFGKKNMHNRSDWKCELGLKNKKTSFFIFGDSHALSFLPASEYASEKMQTKIEFTGAPGCIPFFGIHSLRADQKKINCKELNNRVFEYIKSNRIKNLILIARWSYYTDGGYSGRDFSYLGLNKNSKKSKVNSRDAFRAGLVKTIERYNKIGVKLIFIEQVPQQEIHPLKIYLQADRFYSSDIAALSIDYEKHNKLQDYVGKMFEEFNVNTINFDDILCDKRNCKVGTSSHSYYYDEDHLSVEGSNFLSDYFSREISEYK